MSRGAVVPLRGVIVAPAAGLVALGAAWIGCSGRTGRQGVRKAALLVPFQGALAIGFTADIGRVFGTGV